MSLLHWVGRLRRRRDAIDGDRPGRRSRVASGYARTVVRLRWVIAVGWLVITFAAAMWLPNLSETGAGSSDIGGLVAPDSPPIQAEIHSIIRFGFPVLSRVAVVQRNPDGLDPYAQARTVLSALALDQTANRNGRGVIGALPVTNTARLFPSSMESGTTAITYLFTGPFVSFSDQSRLARGYAAKELGRADDHVVGVTGTIPGRARQASLVSDALPAVEVATLLMIMILVGLNFRALVAPGVTILTAGVAYLVTSHVVGYLGGLLGISVPSDLEPLIVALLLGIVTDYAIFYISGFRARLLAGDDPREAVTRSTADFTPIVVAAGLTVASGVAVLVVARSPLFQAFGPGMALTVLTALVVAMTLVPALLAILGARVFWPSRPGSARSARVAAADDTTGPGPTDLVAGVVGGQPGHRLIRALTHRGVAALAALACVGGLLLAAAPMLHLRLGMSVVSSLPSTVEESKAADAATAGFSKGILSPSVLLVEEKGITAKRTALERLQAALEQQPGVAGVLGPRQELTQFVKGAVLSPSGDAVRYLVVFDAAPLGALAIEHLRDLQAELPTLLAGAGLGAATTEVAGDTALAERLVQQTEGDLGRLALAVIVVDLALLVIFLRALIAPLYLLATSILAVAAALGITTFVFQDVIGEDGLTFYVPFAAAVLLIALGSDYNIFGVGHVWDVAGRRPLREALIEAVPQSTRAITAAGITLALSFGLLAIVPLRPFRQLAVAMTVGVLLDAFLVRAVLVPCLLTLVGPFSGWPGSRLRRGHAAGADPSGQSAAAPASG